jgi:hypothetical protein
MTFMVMLKAELTDKVKLVRAPQFPPQRERSAKRWHAIFVNRIIEANVEVGLILVPMQ